MVGIIIELRDLISRIQHGDAALRKQERMEHDIKSQRPVCLHLILLIKSGLDAAQRSCCAAQSCVLQPGIVIIQLTSRV